LLAWYLIIIGVMHLISALAGPKVSYWWTQLLLGVAELILGVWAVRSWQSSLLTLLTLVGVWAILYGVAEIFAAFSIRQAGQAGRAPARLTDGGPGIGPHPVGRPHPVGLGPATGAPGKAPKGRRRREHLAAAQDSQPGAAAARPGAQEEHGEPGRRPDHAIRRLDAVRLHPHHLVCRLDRLPGPYPFGLLTMIVSLEAIFLSTFVMISQNRADDKRQVLADHQWQTVQQEEQQNEQLLHISNQILELTKAIHALSTGQSDGLANQAGDEVDRAPHDDGAAHTRQHGVGEQLRTPDPSIAHRGVGRLVAHADR
jgi:hypothetical protein